MSLSPCKTDPNYDNERIRKAAQPDSFNNNPLKEQFVGADTEKKLTKAEKKAAAEAAKNADK